MKIDLQLCMLTRKSRSEYNHERGVFPWGNISSSVVTDTFCVIHDHVCMVTHIARVYINRVRLPILHVVSSTRKMSTSLSAFAPESIPIVVV